MNAASALQKLGVTDPGVYHSLGSALGSSVEYMTPGQLLKVLSSFCLAGVFRGGAGLHLKVWMSIQQHQSASDWVAFDTKHLHWSCQIIIACSCAENTNHKIVQG